MTDTPARAGMGELSKNHLHELKKLKQKKYRLESNQTLAEGFNLIEQLAANGIFPEEIIAGDIAKALSIPNLRCKILLARPHELETLADTETPQPMLGIYAIPSTGFEDYRMALYLDGIRDPGNLGTIFRSAAAFGLDGVVLSQDCCEVFSPKVIRASLGSVFWVPSLTAGPEWLQRQDALKAGLSSNGSSSLRDFRIDKSKQLIIVMGSESRGISPEIRALLDAEVRIPISDRMESLNAATATGIALYEMAGRFCVDEKGRAGSLVRTRKRQLQGKASEH